MNRVLTTVLALLLAGCASPPPSDRVHSRPNVIVILTDDQGWQDTSEPFAAERTPLNERYRTPNLERLADQGMKFTNAYSNAVCTPTRVEPAHRAESSPDAGFELDPFPRPADRQASLGSDHPPMEHERPAACR